jgi:Fur family ferric uptake transcriptional regulator
MTHRKRQNGAAFHRLVEEMRKSKLKMTEPRKAILEILLADHGPFTVDEIHSQIPRRNCDLVTIYRFLSGLEEVGLLRRCDFGDGAVRYEIAEQQGSHHHHHVICKKCRTVKVLEDCELDQLDKFPSNLGFSEVSHSLEFFGICPSCK